MGLVNYFLVGDIWLSNHLTSPYNWTLFQRSILWWIKYMRKYLCILSFKGWSWEIWGYRKTTLFSSVPIRLSEYFFLEYHTDSAHFSHKYLEGSSTSKVQFVHACMGSWYENSFYLFFALLKQPNTINYWVPFLFCSTLIKFMYRNS